MNRIALLLLVLVGFLPRMHASQTDSVSAPGLPQVLVASGGAIVVNAAVTEGLKASVHEMRPDRSANNSFPSRHTSWAFTASSALSAALYHHSPWWSVAGQALASSIGLQRVASRRHWGSDVVSGACIGIASTELACLISRKIFGGPSPWRQSVYCGFRPSLAVESEAIYWLTSMPGYTMATGFGTALHFQMPLSDHWGVAISASGMSTPVKAGGRYHAPLSSVSGLAGAVCHYTLPCDRLALVGNAEAGLRRWIGAGDVRTVSYGFDASVAAALEWHLTASFAFRGKAAYRLTTIPHALQAITLSVSSVVLF